MFNEPKTNKNLKAYYFDCFLISLLKRTQFKEITVYSFFKNFYQKYLIV